MCRIAKSFTSFVGYLYLQDPLILGSLCVQWNPPFFPATDLGVMSQLPRIKCSCSASLRTKCFLPFCLVVFSVVCRIECPASPLSIVKKNVKENGLLQDKKKMF